MKKLITIFLVLALVIPAAAFADLPDISGLSFEELVQLRNSITIAMWNSEDWQEVIVPAGTWKVGEDIPAGHWSILIVGHGLTSVYYCEEVDELGKPVCWGAKYVRKDLASSDFNGFNETYNTMLDFDAKEGWYFVFDKSVMFMPYVGKPTFNFK